LASLRVRTTVSLLALASPALAQKAHPTVDQQIATSVMALPEGLRAGATVMGWKTPSGKMEVLRQGTNGMNCLAQFAVEKNFHVSCYHEGMEPFMLRGRQLRDEGTTGTQVDSVRFREVRDGKLRMPVSGALYQLFGSDSSWNATTGKLSGVRSLFVMYIPGATTQSTGLSTAPRQDGPWLMFPGTPKAHIMISGSMQP
jgi:hypothetical protein